MPWDLLSLLGVLLVLVLVLAGCCVVTRWAGTGLAGGGFGSMGQQRHMKVVERLPVGKDLSLLVVQLADRYYLLGCSHSGVRDMLRKFREKK